MTVNVYHKHSVVKGKAPDAKQLELGEIAINANQDSPAIYIKDSADNIVEIGGGCDCDAIEGRLDKIEADLEIIGNLPNQDQIDKINDLIDILDQLRIDVDKNAADIAALVPRVEALETEVDTLKALILSCKDDINQNKDDIAENRKDLDAIDIVAGRGINVAHVQDTFKWVVSIDTAWLDSYVKAMTDEALKPYALLDIDDNLEDISKAS